jgi:hypothetical protein
MSQPTLAAPRLAARRRPLHTWGLGVWKGKVGFERPPIIWIIVIAGVFNSHNYMLEHGTRCGVMPTMLSLVLRVQDVGA